MSDSLFQSVKDMLVADEWPIAALDGFTGVRSNFNGESGIFPVFVLVYEQHDQIVVYSNTPTEVGDDHRAAVAELIHRANFGLRIGNFEMDLEDGETRFKTSMDVEGGELSVTMLQNLLQINVLTMDRYLPAITSVAAGDATAAQALGQVEGEG